MTFRTSDVDEPQRVAAPPARPEIQVNGRSIDSVVTDAWAAVRRANSSPTVFLQAGRMVRLLEGRCGPEVILMNGVAFYEHLGRVANWMRATPRGIVDVFPRKDVARAMLAALDSKLPVLDAVVCAPVFGASGSVLSEPGYHAEDRLWHHLPAGAALPSISTQPSADDVAEARQLFERELLGDFPFALASDRAHALAALLLPFARRLADGPVPAHLVEATMTGSGRSLFVDVVSILATGSLVHGGQVALQVPEVKEFDPQRHRSKRFVSGGVRIRLDARTDRPWLRTGFRHPDLREWALAQRSQLVQAALLLVQNWLGKGRPSGKVRLLGFERWSEAMGGILAAVGVQGFLDGVSRPLGARMKVGEATGLKLVDINTATHVLADLVAGWEELPNGFGSGGCTAAQALEALQEDVDAKQYVRLRSALGALCPHPPGPLFTARMMGCALRRFRGRISGDRMLSTRRLRGNNVWFVQLLA
jgi:hypothetical protein